jgi:hypothetical protein
MAGERVFRCEIEANFQEQLVQNIYHVKSTIPEVYASQVAITTMEHFVRRLMQLQVANVTYERLIVTCLNPEAPHMYVLDLENETPGNDVLSLPSMVAWKWTGRNLGTVRNFIGGFYLYGMPTFDWTFAGQITSGGTLKAKNVRDAIMSKLGVGGDQVMRLGTYSRTLKKKFPAYPVNDCFVPWSSLNFNAHYTSMRKRTPGIGR